MPVQRRSIAAPIDIPEPDCLVKAATGQDASIRTPGHRPHPVGMPRKRLAHTSAGHFPELDGAIPTPAGQGASIGCKSQCEHPVGMPHEHPHAGTWLCPREIPQSNMGVEAPTGEQAPIGTPGQGVHRAAMARERPQGRAGLRVQKLDDRICPAASERASIGGKSQALDIVGLPARPEQGAAL